MADDSGASEGNSAKAAAQNYATSSEGSVPQRVYPLDEQTLGRAESVFDAGVEFEAPAPPPHDAPGPAVAAGPGAAPGPKPAASMSARERRRRVRLQARRVRRIIRHIEPWSVLKLSIVFFACLWLILVLAGLLLWSFAERSGTLDSVEDLIESLFALDPDEEFWSGTTIFRAYAIGGSVMAIAGVAFNVLLCVLYNLLSDLLGGIRITVIEEESARFRPPKRRSR